MSIIGIVLGVIAIGLFIWLKKDQQMSNALHEGDLIAAKHAYEALMDDFNNYQVETDRKIAQLEKDIIIKAKEQDKNLVKLTKNLLPSPIPWIPCNPGQPPDITGDSAGSKATNLHLGYIFFINFPAPIIVPPVPVPATKASIFLSKGKSLQTSNPVVYQWEAIFNSLWN